MKRVVMLSIARLNVMLIVVMAIVAMLKVTMLSVMASIMYSKRGSSLLKCAIKASLVRNNSKTLNSKM